MTQLRAPKVRKAVCEARLKLRMHPIHSRSIWTLRQYACLGGPKAAEGGV